MNEMKILFIVIILFLEGCIIPSLHPLFTKDDIVFDPILIGTWIQETDNDVSWIFEKSEDNTYEVTIKWSENIDKFKVHLIKLKQFVFLDFYPQQENVNTYYFIPTHIFFRVWIEENMLRIAILDKQWFEDIAVKNKQGIAYERLEDSNLVVFTSSTKELQKFILNNAENNLAFSDVMRLSRKKE